MKSAALRLDGVLGLVVTLCLLAPACAIAAASPDESHDGLVPVSGTKLAAVYLKPGADFRGYDAFDLRECHVAFRKNWQRDQNRADPFRVTKRDMDEIRAALGELFSSVFTEELGKGGYRIAAPGSPDVLLLRPAIVDLDIAVPASATKTRGRTFATSAGSMTLYLEIFDSTTGEILGRIADRRSGRESASLRWQNAATNRREAEVVLRDWATTLREGLDVLRGRGAAPEGGDAR